MWRMHWSPPPRPTPVLSRRQWSGATGWAPNSGGRSHSPCPFLSLPSALSLGPPASLVTSVVECGGLLLLRHWSPQSEQLQCGGRSCPGHPLSCPGGGTGPWHEPLPSHFHTLPEAGRGRAPALPPSRPAPGPGIGGHPRMDPAPSYHLLEGPAEGRWQGPPTPAQLPVSPDWAAAPAPEPLPSAATLCSLSCPLLLYLETTCCNKS